MSSDLEDLGSKIKTIQWHHHRALDAKLVEVGTTLVQWNALREIARNPGSSAHALAELTFNSDQAFGTLSTRLMRRGFIYREAGIGRANVHQLTDKGKRMLTAGQAIMRSVLGESFVSLNLQERATLSALLTKLIKHRDNESRKVLQTQKSISRASH